MSDPRVSEEDPRGGVTIGFWPHTTNWQVASARLRCQSIVQGLAELGMAVRLYTPGDAPPSILVLSKRYDARTMTHALELREQHGTRLFLDLCDNHFHNDHATPLFVDRAQQLCRSIRQVDQLIVASAALADAVRQHVDRPPPTSVIGDLVEDSFTPPSDWRQRLRGQMQLARLFAWLRVCRPASGRRLVWFGNHGSPNVEGGMQDLCKIFGVLAAHHAERRLSLTVVSNSHPRFLELTKDCRFPCYYVPWSEASFDAALRMHDIAVIPVTPTPFTRCKTANRVATATVHGLAVAADAIPAYEEFAPAIVLDAWHDGLRRLMDDAEDRAARIRAAACMLTERYAPPVILNQWRRVLLAQASTDCPVPTT